VRRTWLEERLGNAFRLRACHDFGLRSRDMRVGLGADGGRLTPHDPRNWEGLQLLLRSLGLYRKVALDYRVPVSELLDRLAALGPDVLSSSPSVLARIGRAMASDRPGAIAPRLVISGGEVLTPLERRQISESFGARVVDMYSSHEAGLIAWECSRGTRLHVADDSVILEVLKDGRPAEPGEAGEVVATRLHAFAMPFIRYRLGDLVTRGPGPCPCGAPFSTILTVQGRMTDYFQMPDGRLLRPYELVIIIHQQAARWVGQFQLTQETRERVVLRVAPLVPPAGRSGRPRGRRPRQARRRNRLPAPAGPGDSGRDQRKVPIEPVVRAVRLRRGRLGPPARRRYGVAEPGGNGRSAAVRPGRPAPPR